MAHAAFLPGIRFAKSAAKIVRKKIRVIPEARAPARFGGYLSASFTARRERRARIGESGDAHVSRAALLRAGELREQVAVVGLVEVLPVEVRTLRPALAPNAGPATERIHGQPRIVGHR